MDEAPARSERVWREEFSELLGADELRVLGEPSLRDSITMIAVIWIEVIVLLTAANLLPRLPLGWAIAAGVVVVVLMGTRINALGVMLHEASHGSLARSRKVNDRLANWTLAFWTVNSVEEYRPTHRLHHRYLGGERDPDRVAYLIPDRRGALTFLLVQDLVGITAIRRATTLAAGAGPDADAGAASGLLARPSLLAGKILAQLVVLAQFVLVQGIVRGCAFYVVFWLFPVACMYPMILRLKNITEHFDPRLRIPGVAPWIARTSCAGRIQNHLVGARMEYHFEHHVVPTIPFPGLKKLHRLLDDRGLFADHAEVLSQGYVRFVGRTVTGHQPAVGAPAPDTAAG